MSTRVTMGAKVRKFEQMWAERVGLKHVVCVNSGSSANLIAVGAMVACHHWKAGDEVIVPATTWSTTVFPLIQYGLVPVFADIDEYFCLSPQSVEAAFSEKTRGVFVVPLLGNAFDPQIPNLARERGVDLLCDCCEAHGTELDGRDIGSYGILNTWSTFFSHILSTIEGGLVGTNDSALADILRGLRAHGWVREMEDDDFAQRYPEIDSRFLFREIGYNLRPTELTGAFGVHQVPKLRGFVERNRQLVDDWATELEEWKDWLELPNDRPGARHAFFGFSFVVKPEAPFSRKDLTTFLNERGIDTRPIMGGDLRLHPFMRYQFPIRSVATFRTDLVFQRGFFVGLHSGITSELSQYFLQTMRDFLSKY